MKTMKTVIRTILEIIGVAILFAAWYIVCIIAFADGVTM